MEICTQQPIAAKKARGRGKPFTRNDTRINRGGVPSEIRAFHHWMRESFAASLQERTDEGRTKGEQIIRTLIKKAIDGDMRAAEYILDRMGGKPLQSVELSGSVGSFALSDADRAAAQAIVMRLRVVEPNQID
jgi:hypothetical protein